MTQTFDSKTGISLGAIALGAFVCIALQLIFLTLGSATGLSSSGFEHGFDLGQGIILNITQFAAIGLGVSFFVGGWVASRTSKKALRSSSLWHAVGSWSMSLVVATFLIGNFAVILGLASVAESAGSAIGGITREISRTRISTDISMFKGKAITQIVPSSSRPASEKIHNATVTAKNIAADASRCAFQAILFGAFMSLAGGLLGYKRRSAES